MKDFDEKHKLHNNQCLQKNYDNSWLINHSKKSALSQDDGKKAEIYVLNASIFQDTDAYNFYFDKMPDERQKKANDFVFDKDKLLCVGAWSLLNASLSEFGIELSATEILRTINNKPFLKGNSAYFNLSHSGQYVACAVSNREVGVDIQTEKPVDQPLINHCMTKYEIQYYLSSEDFLPANFSPENSSHTTTNFFRLWTLKESVMKALGTGLMLDPGKIEILNLPNIQKYVADNASACKTINKHEGVDFNISYPKYQAIAQEMQLKCHEIPAPEGYKLSVCF